MKLHTFFALCAAAVLGIANPAAAADHYPDKPIKLVIPYPAGGTTDVLGRIVADKLGQSLGETIVVENKPGANSMIGVAQVARSQPDGYTLLLTSNSVVVNEFMYEKPTYDALKDLKPVTLVASTPYFLIVNSELPVKSVKDLVALAKKKPGALTFGAPGFGGTPHLVSELFQLSTGTNMLLVPYKGTGPAITDLAAGQINLMFVGLPSAAGLVKKGTLRLLATAESQRSELMPDLPTIKEAGYDGVAANNWFGILAPAGLPDSIAERIATAMSKILRTDDIKQKFAGLGAEPLASTPAEFNKRYLADREFWGKLIGENKSKFHN